MLSGANNGKGVMTEGLSNVPVFFLSASTVSFVVGLIIVNLYLATYGIFSLDIIRTEYLLAGAIFLFLIIMAGGILYFIERFIRSLHRAWGISINSQYKSEIHGLLFKKSDIALCLFLVPFGVVTELFAVEHFSAFQFPLNKFVSWLGIFSLFSAPIIIKFIAIGLSGHLGESVPLDNTIVVEDQGKRNNTATDALRKHPLLFFGLFSLLLFSCVELYSTGIYPYIQKSYGGGANDEVIIIPNQSGLEVCKALSLPVTNNNLVGPLKVLTESDKELIILVNNEISGKEIAIRLSKNYINAIQAVPNWMYRTQSANFSQFFHQLITHGN